MKYQNIRVLADLIKTRQDSDMDAVLAISSDEGLGKSTLSIQLAMLIIQNFDLEKNMAYANKEIMAKFKDLEPNKGLIIDEAIRAIYKRDWMKNLNKTLIKLFAQIRFKRLFIILNIPNFLDLDKQIRNHRVFMWIHIYERGKAVIFKRSDSAYDKEDPWDLRSGQKIVRRYYKSSLDDKDELLKGYKKQFTYVGHMTFPDLPDNVKKKYLAISHKRKMEEDEEEITLDRLLVRHILYKLYTEHYDGDKGGVPKIWADWGLDKFCSHRTILTRIQEEKRSRGEADERNTRHEI